MTRLFFLGCCLLLGGCSSLLVCRDLPEATPKGEPAVAVGAPAGTLAPASLPAGVLPADLVAMQQTARFALDGPRVNQASTWFDRTTRHGGAITPLWLELGPKGEECRSYLQLLLLDQQRHQARGTACRQADGQWLIVR